MRNLKKHIIIAISVLAVSAGAMFLGNHASAAELAPKDPAGPVSAAGRDYKIALREADRQGNKNVVHQAVEEKAEEAKDQDSRFDRERGRRHHREDGEAGEYRREGRHHSEGDEDHPHRKDGEGRHMRGDRRGPDGEGRHMRHGDRRGPDGEGRHRRHGDWRGPDGERPHMRHGDRRGPDGEGRRMRHGDWRGPDGERPHMRHGDRRGPDGEGRHMRHERRDRDGYGERRIHRDGERHHDRRYGHRHFAGPRSDRPQTPEDANS